MMIIIVVRKESEREREREPWITIEMVVVAGKTEAILDHE
jgi:hypothetical protein